MCVLPDNGLKWTIYVVCQFVGQQWYSWATPCVFSLITLDP